MPSMSQHDATFVDTLWKALKAWAKEQATGSAIPSVEECAAEVRRISSEIIGPSGALRAEAVDFFAVEASEMIVKLRANPNVCNT